jgi:hypothetical protein
MTLTSGPLLRRAACVLLAAALGVVIAHAQGPLDRIPPDGQPLRIDRAADIPPPLKAALERTDCRQSEAMLGTFPIELFRPAAGSRPMAIVPCIGLVLSGRAFLLDRDGGGEPLAFPVMGLPGKVTQSETPGFLTWSRANRTLVALNGNDVCEGTMTRHTYRHDPRHDGDDLNGFALIKLERGRLGCEGADHNWQVVWEAGAPR